MIHFKEIILCGRATVLPTTIEVSIDDNNFTLYTFASMEEEEIHRIPVPLNHRGIHRVEIKTVEGQAIATQTRAEINGEDITDTIKIKKLNFYLDGIYTPMQHDESKDVGEWHCEIPQSLFFELSVDLNH